MDTKEYLYSTKVKKKTGIPHQKYQPCCPNNPPDIELYHKITPYDKKGEQMGTTNSPVLGQTGTVTLDKILQWVT